MRLDAAIFMLAIAALFAMAYHASADPVDAVAIVRQTRAEEPDTEAMRRHVARSEPAVVLALTAWLEAGALVSEGEVAAIHEGQLPADRMGLLGRSETPSLGGIACARPRASWRRLAGAPSAALAPRASCG